MAEEKQKRIHIFASGRVQGVFYRAFVKKMANECKIDGWVRNLPDSRVKIIAEGPEYHINHFTELCREGNTLARVENFDAREEKVTGSFAGFEVIY